MQATTARPYSTTSPEHVSWSDAWRAWAVLYWLVALFHDAPEHDPSNLGSATLLRIAPGGANVAASLPTTHSLQATLYPTCGEASIVRLSPSAGRQFRTVTAGRIAAGPLVATTDPVTGEAYQRTSVVLTGDRKRQYQADQDAERRASQLAEVGLAQRLLDESPELEPDAMRRWMRFERNLRTENRQRWVEERCQRSEQSARRRASGRIRRYCRHNRIDHLWTLTHEQAETSWTEVVKEWRYFLDQFQRLAGHHAVVGVIEPHPGGHGYHLHFGVHGFVDQRIVRQCWTKGRGYGINVVSFVGRKSGAPPKRIASYLAKYVAKGLTQEACEAAGLEPRRKGQHRYFVAEGVQPDKLVFLDRSRLRLIRQLTAYMGVPMYYWCSDQQPSWEGPRVDFFDWWADAPGSTGARHWKRRAPLVATDARGIKASAGGGR